jgi:hypothetical protein
MPAEAAIEYEDCGRSAKRYAARFPKAPDAGRALFSYVRDELRAVVFVISTTKKGTSRSGQEYESPLLVLNGVEYAAMPFQALHDRLCTTLRGDRPCLLMEVFGADGTRTLVFDDGSTAPGPPITKDEGSDDSG